MSEAKHTLGPLGKTINGVWWTQIALDNLYAAAPDLLEALTALRDAVQNNQRKHDCPGFDCAICTPSAELVDAAAAIAKAKGETE